MASPPLDPHRYLESLQADRCVLCFLTHSDTQEHLKSLFEEHVTDPKSREGLRASRGFCRGHAWMAVNLGQSLGLSVLYADLIQEEMDRLSRKAPFFKRQGRKPCPLCESGKKIEQAHVRHFTAAWGQSEALREAFSRKGVLCLDHLDQTLAEAGPSHRQSLLKAAQKALEAVLKDLNEFLEKQDYHRSLDPLGKERDAWLRAVRLVSGEREG